MTTINSLLEYPKGTLLFLIALVNIVWLFYVLRKGMLLKIVRGYTLYAFFAFFWIITNAYFQSELLTLFSEKFAVKMALLSNLSGCFMTLSLFYLSCLVKNTSKKNISLWSYIFIGLIGGTNLLINLYPGWTVKGVDIISVGDFVLHQGPLAGVFFIITAASIIPTIVNFVLALKTKQKVENKKNLYILFGTIFMYAGALGGNIFGPMFFDNYGWAWIPPAFSITDVVIVGYSILAKRFFDLQLTAQKGAMYVSNILLYGLLFGGAFKLFQQASISIEVFAGLCLVAGGTVVALWKWTLETFDVFWNYVFYQKKQNPVEAIGASLQGFKKSMSLGMEELTKALEVQDSRFVFAEEGAEKYQPLFQFFQAHPGQDLVKDEVDYVIRNIEPRKELRRIRENMEAYMVSAAIPVLDDDKNLLGVLLLEQKINGKLFSNQEMSETKILLENATIYLSKCSDREKIKANLKDSLTVEKEFMTGLIHEIRTPLMLAENLKDLIDWKKLKIEDQQFIASSQEGLQELSHKLDRVSEAFQWKNQLMPLEKTFGTLDKLFDAVLNEGYWDGEIELKLDRNLKGKLLEFDFHNLKRAIGEIIKNAFFFNQQKIKRLKIQVERADGEIVFDFEDNGMGIEREHWERIFDLLYVVAFSRNPSECGLGAGLSIAKGIIQGHDGEVEVLESEIGSGTIIRLRMPLNELN